MCAPPKNYEMPQLERLELEELTMKVSPGECGRVLSLFRDAVEAREPEVSVYAYFDFVVYSLLFTFFSQ